MGDQNSALGQKIEMLHSAMASLFPDFRADYFTVTDILETGIVACRQIEPVDLRPGGSVSGPTLMAFADAVSYLTIFAHLGVDAMAVTTHLSIDFLAKPRGDRIFATSEILRAGRSQVTILVRIATKSSSTEWVAVATVTYARLNMAPDSPNASSSVNTSSSLREASDA